MACHAISTKGHHSSGCCFALRENVKILGVCQGLVGHGFSAVLCQVLERLGTFYRFVARIRNKAGDAWRVQPKRPNPLTPKLEQVGSKQIHANSPNLVFFQLNYLPKSQQLTVARHEGPVYIQLNNLGTQI